MKPLAALLGGFLLGQAVYCSSGDEGTLKEWDATNLALKRQIDLEGAVPHMTLRNREQFSAAECWSWRKPCPTDAASVGQMFSRAVTVLA